MSRTVSATSTTTTISISARRALLSACIASTLAFAGSGCGDKSTEPNEPPSFAYVLGTAPCTTRDSGLPAKGIAFTDSCFHCAITRITDRQTDSYSGPGIENEYARTDPENSDGSRIMLRGNDGEWYLYDARNLQLLHHLDIAGGGEEPEPRWSPSRANLFYYIYGPELREYDISTDTSRSIHDFHFDLPAAAYITTRTEGDASTDRGAWCFMIEDDTFAPIAVITYDMTHDLLLGQRTQFPDAINWVSMDPSGRHCLIGYESREGEVCSPDFSSNHNLPAGASGHMDLAVDAAGRDVLVYRSSTTDWIAMTDLDHISEVELLEIPFPTNTDIGLHFSGNCVRTPGWVLVSTYGSRNPPSGRSHSWMDEQIFMVELKTDPRIWRIAHTHSFTSLDYEGEKNYFAEAFATINRTGTRIVFGSNWKDMTTDYSEAYRIDLPEGWASSMPASRPVLWSARSASGPTR